MFTDDDLSKQLGDVQAMVDDLQDKMRQALDDYPDPKAAATWHKLKAELDLAQALEASIQGKIDQAHQDANAERIAAAKFNYDRESRENKALRDELDEVTRGVRIWTNNSRGVPLDERLAAMDRIHELKKQELDVRAKLDDSARKVQRARDMLDALRAEGLTV